VQALRGGGLLRGDGCGHGAIRASASRQRNRQKREHGNSHGFSF
jgi:hypothetical protein